MSHCFQRLFKTYYLLSDFFRACQGVLIRNLRDSWLLNSLLLLSVMSKTDINIIHLFFIWAFFHKHSPFTGQQGKGQGISLSPLYHFYPLHRHLDISGAINAESSPLHIACSRIRTGNLWFPNTSRYPLIVVLVLTNDFDYPERY